MIFETGETGETGETCLKSWRATYQPTQGNWGPTPSTHKILSIRRWFSEYAQREKIRRWCLAQDVVGGRCWTPAYVYTQGGLLRAVLTVRMGAKVTGWRAAAEGFTRRYCLARATC